MQAQQRPILDVTELSNLFDSYYGMVYQCLFNEDLTMTFLSRGCLSLTGYDVSELINNHPVSYQDIIVDEHRQYVFQTISDSVEAKESFQLEYCILHKNGSHVWVSERGVPVYDAEGKVRFLQGYIQDITEEKTSALALTEAESRYRSIFEHAPDGIFQSTKEGQYLAINQALASIYGYENPDEMLLQLADIANQLYVDPNRREAFLNQLDTEGFVSNFESQVYRKNKEIIWISENARKVHNEECEFLYYEGTVQNICTRKQHEAEIEYKATHDSLTGIPNRYSLHKKLEASLDRCQADNATLGVAFVDIDHFKRINDTMGHEVGDALLKAVTTRIATSIRDLDMVARLGGDEFVVLIPNEVHDNEASGVASIQPVVNRILAAIREPFLIENYEYNVSCSIGLSVFPFHAKTQKDMLKNADLALHEAKRLGRNKIQLYSKDLAREQFRKLEVEYRLRCAMENKEFLLHYQPKVSMSSGEILGMEALIRWQPLGEKMVPPIAFIDVAEQTGLIVAIGSWVMATACQKVAEWNMKWGTNYCVAVNVSPAQFRQEHFIETVEFALNKSGLPAQLLELEITEGLAASDVSAFLKKLKVLKRIGVRLAIDDFGTGYSSLAYLKNFPIDCLKIDKTFVSQMESEPENAAILEAIVVLGHSLGMTLVAEGIETAYQHDFLAELGCDMFQGYFYSKPLPEEVFEMKMKHLLK